MAEPRVVGRIHCVHFTLNASKHTVEFAKRAFAGWKASPTRARPGAKRHSGLTHKRSSRSCA